MTTTFPQEDRMVRDMVSASCCNTLQNLGLKIKAAYMWLITDQGHFLANYHFDTCGFYEDTDSQLLEAKGARLIQKVPAFSALDMNACLPAYMLIKDMDQGLYEISLDKHFEQIPMITERRLPDALARLLIEMMSKRMYKPEDVAATIAGGE
jgi:hypothetical protein